MKTLLVLSVLLGCLLVVTATEEVKEEAPAGEEPDVAPPQDEAPPPEGRFLLCPTGWYKFRDSCFLYSRLAYSWGNAAAYCARNGASMASAHNVFDYKFLQDITLREGGSTAWMGGFNFQGWRWLDQSSFSYSNWYLLSSSSANPCLYLNVRAGWSNASCAGGRPFICVKKMSFC